MKRNARREHTFVSFSWNLYKRFLSRRGCSTTKGSLECWKSTTDGFTYGLSTAMVDFCRVVINLRNLTDPVCIFLYINLLNY